MIQGHGNASADIILVADGGTKEDVSTNYALSGYSQGLLEQVIGSSFHINETYRTCLIKEQISYTPEGKVPYYEQRENLQKIQEYQECLLDEINTIKPNLIIPLGELSMRHLTELQGIRN